MNCITSIVYGTQYVNLVTLMYCSTTNDMETCLLHGTRQHGNLSTTQQQIIWKLVYYADIST